MAAPSGRPQTSEADKHQRPGGGFRNTIGTEGHAVEQGEGRDAVRDCRNRVGPATAGGLEIDVAAVLIERNAPGADGAGVAEERVAAVR